MKTPTKRIFSENQSLFLEGTSEDYGRQREHLKGKSKKPRGAGETAQRLRALTALAENLGSIPGTHMTHPSSELCVAVVRGISHCLRLLQAAGTRVVYAHGYMQVK